MLNEVKHLDTGGAYNLYPIPNQILHSVQDDSVRKVPVTKPIVLYQGYSLSYLEPGKIHAFFVQPRYDSSSVPRWYYLKDGN